MRKLKLRVFIMLMMMQDYTPEPGAGGGTPTEALTPVLRRAGCRNLAASWGKWAVHRGRQPQGASVSQCGTGGDSCASEAQREYGLPGQSTDVRVGHHSQTGRTQKTGLFLGKLTEGVLPHTSEWSKQESHQGGPG